MSTLTQMNDSSLEVFGELNRIAMQNKARKKQQELQLVNRMDARRRIEQIEERKTIVNDFDYLLN